MLRNLDVALFNTTEFNTLHLTGDVLHDRTWLCPVNDISKMCNPGESPGTVHVMFVCSLSELRPHFTLASESDPADQEDIDDDTVPQGNAALKDIVPPVAHHDDTVVTSGVSTLSSTVSHESQSAQRSISIQLGRMKLETKR